MQIETRNVINPFTIKYCIVLCHTSMSTVFDSSDEGILLVMLPAELNNHSYGTEIAGMHRTVLVKMPISDIDTYYVSTIVMDQLN